MIFATCVYFLVGFGLFFEPAIALYLLGIGLIAYAMYLKQNA